MKIRPANEDDILDILILARQFAKEAKSHFDKEKTASTIVSLINNSDGTVIVWEDDSGEVVGAILAIMFESFISYRNQAHEIAWFVDKESRGKGGAIKLVKALVNWSEEKGAKDLIMGDIHTLQDLGPLYSRLGFTLTEKLYTKEF
jgi:predicted N-acetyltransferase YhbS